MQVNAILNIKQENYAVKISVYPSPGSYRIYLGICQSPTWSQMCIVKYYYCIRIHLWVVSEETVIIMKHVTTLGPDDAISCYLCLLTNQNVSPKYLMLLLQRISLPLN